MLIDETKAIIVSAIDRFKPRAIVLMVSGGHDSVTNAHVSSRILEELGLNYCVYHGDTTIGIPETQQYVIDICKKYGWTFEIRRSPNEKDHYDNLVARFGFPGPTRFAHQIMYRCLKERALRKFVHELKRHRNDNILLLTGVRKSESKIRMGYVDTTHKEGSKIWCNPIFHWDESDCRVYMRFNKIPLNPVKEKICISGECLCGAFAGKEEWFEIKYHYPEVAARIEALHEVARRNGFPWGWSSGPTEWRKDERAKRQLNLFMCVGCDSRHEFAQAGGGGSFSESKALKQ